jgi:hypothetical protein
MRRLIAQQFQVSNQNDFALLDHIGGECAGAVTFTSRWTSVVLAHKTSCTGPCLNVSARWGFNLFFEAVHRLQVAARL